MIRELVAFVLSFLVSIGLLAPSQPPAPASVDPLVQEAPVSQDKEAPQEGSAASSSAVATTAHPALYPEGSTWLSTLPLGDYKYVTDAPRKGYIYVCHVGEGGGAQTAGPWIDVVNKTWEPAAKISVLGAVSWPNATVSSRISGEYRIISSNDLPINHTTGSFPIGYNDPAYAYDHNPNSIKPQSLTFSIPAKPSAAASPGCIYGEVGIMNNGVMLFDGFDAGMRDAAAWEVQDGCNAHPQAAGEYHYHSLSSCLKNIDVASVVGFAFDGFPITGPKLPNGKYLTTADLDECHGMTSEIVLDGDSVVSYHYVLTEDFPYSVSCFKGTSAFKPAPASQGEGQSGQLHMQEGAPTPPPQALSACAGKSRGQSCSFTGASGESISGSCETPPGATLACVPLHY